MKLVTSVPHPLRVHPNMQFVLSTIFPFPYQKSERSTFLHSILREHSQFQFSRQTLYSYFKQTLLQFFTK